MTWSTFRLWGASLCEAVPSCGLSGFPDFGTVIKCGCCGLRWVTPPSNCEVWEVWSSQARRFAAVTAPPARGVCFHAHFLRRYSTPLAERNWCCWRTGYRSRGGDFVWCCDKVHDTSGVFLAPSDTPNCLELNAPIRVQDWVSNIW